MDEVRDIINIMLDSRGWRSRVLEQMAVELWPEVVGEHLAHHTIALQFKRGTLFVRARSPQWMQELHFHHPRIIARINGRLGREIVQKIRCRVTPPRGIKVGALKPNWEDPTFPAKTPLPKRKTPPKDDFAKRRAQKLTASIDDEEMRATMERLIASALRARKEKSEKANKDGGKEFAR